MKKRIQLILIFLMSITGAPTALASAVAEASPENHLPPLKRKMSIPVVVLDAGHGGEDFGTTSEIGIKEKDVVLDIAHRTRKLLEQMGFDVVMTRSEDQFIKLSDRVKFCDQQEGNLFVSIHANAAKNKSATGFETFVLSPNKESQGIEKYGGFFTYLSMNSRGKKSLKLAKIIQSEMEEATRAEDRGIKMAKFHVLRYSKVPAVLVETGFLSNNEEAKMMNTAEYRNKIALALATSVRRFCRW